MVWSNIECLFSCGLSTFNLLAALRAVFNLFNSSNSFAERTDHEVAPASVSVLVLLRGYN